MAYSDEQLRALETLVSIMRAAITSYAAYAEDRVPTPHTRPYLERPSAEWAVALTNWEANKTEDAWRDLQNAYTVARKAWERAAREFKPPE